MPKEIQQLTSIFRESSRRYGCRRVGVEVERIAFTAEGKSLPYESADLNAPSARALLEKLSAKHHWPIVNSTLDKPIGLSTKEGKVSLEPGSQLEFSTEPYPSLGEVEEVLTNFENKVNEITQPWKVNWLSLGLNPVQVPEDLTVIPNPRYHIMSEYLPTKGGLGLAMMRLSTSVQINLDYTCEQEGIDMLRVALLAAPISYALFANSPIYKGQKSGYLSYRGKIWEDTDPDRSGLLPQVFDADFNFESYARYLYQLPLMFAENKKGVHVPGKGLSLKDIDEGKLPEVEVNPANRLSAVRQAFTEARLKPGYVEVRSVDGQNPAYRYAASAFWMGILYDSCARDIVLRRLMRVSPEKRSAWQAQVIKTGLNTSFEGLDTRVLAEEFFEAAVAGIRKRVHGEERYLTPLRENLRQALCPADLVLKQFEEKCHRDMACLIKSSAM